MRALIWVLLVMAGTVNAQDAARVVALDVSAADTLIALGVEPVGVVRPLFVDYLETDAEKAGSLFEPDLEVINRLQPDLIVAGARMAKHSETLEGLAPVRQMALSNNAFSDAIDLINDLAKMTHTEDKGKALVVELNSQRDRIQAKSASAGRTLIVMTNGPKISVYGPEGRFGWLHTELGFRAADEAIENSAHGQVASFEYIQTVNPEFMIVIDRLAAVGRPGDSAQVTLDNALVAQTDAWKNGQVLYLNAANAYIAKEGATALTQVLVDIHNAL